MTVIDFGEIACRCRRHKPSDLTMLGITIQVWGAVCATGNLEVIEPASKQLELQL